MNRGRIKKTAIALMAVFLLVISTSGIALANDLKRMETDPFKEKDFSSCRLLVAAEDASVFPEDAPVLSSYNDTFLLQYQDQESTKKAYLYYLEQADAVDVDTVMQICDEEGDDDLEETRMTEEDNPFTELEAAVSEVPQGKYDVALIDTGANDVHVIETVSLIGDDPADHNGHGTRMARFMSARKAASMRRKSRWRCIPPWARAMRWSAACCMDLSAMAICARPSGPAWRQERLLS